MIAYGYSVKEHDDPYVDVVEAAVNGFSESLEPGAFLVDLIPFRESFVFRWRVVWMLITPAFSCSHSLPLPNSSGNSNPLFVPFVSFLHGPLFTSSAIRT